ncbi:MAG: hypothetical protein SP1CHLAM54_10380 [Chlamydiia bacterium]|nr:hypothetical protein [Chlamydiia bacterium]MCH9615943.1 hypothetical protein [Chlamydiia bacterium]MCH9628654.1 hypothetical protein [Chlamydiia bacterium]
MFIPKELLALDLELRGWISERVSRGQVTCRLSKKERSFAPDFEVLKAVKDEWETLGSKLGVSEGLTLAFLADQAGKSVTVADLDKKVLKRALNGALEAMISMREAEGQELISVMQERLDAMEEKVVSLQDIGSRAVLKFEAKLKARLESLKAEGKGERIALETVLLAEKVDITEEIERLESHFKQMQKALSEDVVGKKLDFLLQEMNREVNTVMSKSQEIEIVNIGLFLKVEIDKLREQARNIE